jgi:hypothetical protein
LLLYFSFLLVFLFLFFFFPSFFFHNKLFSFYNYLYVHMIWISTKPYKTHMWTNTYTNIHIPVSVFFFDYRYIWESIVVWKSDVLRGLLLIQ